MSVFRFLGRGRSSVKFKGVELVEARAHARTHIHKLSDATFIQIYMDIFIFCHPSRYKMLTNKAVILHFFHFVI